MRNRPVIGVSGWYNPENKQLAIKNTYFEALYQAGGLPVLLPYAENKEMAREIVGSIDGLLLAGGGDILPARYGEKTLETCGKLEEERDVSELLIIEAALEHNMPIFGICRGVQILAVALGGTLFQDIPSQLGLPPQTHRQETPSDQPHHAVRFKEGGLFARITDTELMLTNSLHHQSIKDAGPRLRIEGITMDGIVEAVSMIGREEVFGVQFHPECLAHYNDWAKRLFVYFIEKAVAYAQNRC